MIKVELKELIMALDMLQKTSSNTHISMTEDSHTLRITYTDAAGQLVTVTIYHADTNEMAKITRSEKLLHASKRGRE